MCVYAIYINKLVNISIVINNKIIYIYIDNTHKTVVRLWVRFGTNHTLDPYWNLVQVWVQTTLIGRGQHYGHRPYPKPICLHSQPE